MQLSTIQQAEIFVLIEQGLPPARVAKTGYTALDPVYLTDLVTYIYEIEQNDPFDIEVQNRKRLIDVSTATVRLSQEDIDSLVESLTPPPG
jgi:hypothetical protein